MSIRFGVTRQPGQRYRLGPRVHKTSTQLLEEGKKLTAHMEELERSTRQQNGEIAQADFAREKEMLGVANANVRGRKQRDKRRRGSRTSKETNARLRKLGVRKGLDRLKKKKKVL